jgi:tripartite-type tricarboxylate transporter receptor subunit TctC
MGAGMKTRALSFLIAFGAALTASGPVHAQGYPSKPVTMIVPFPAGGGSDILARIVAEHMRPTLGQPVIIENIGGAGGTIGTTIKAAGIKLE